MTKVMTTKMSSKGQVVLPEALRQMYGWESGTAFTILTYKGSIIMQPLKTPTEDEIEAEFEDAFAEARRQAKEAGMTPRDITDAISAVRRERRARRAIP
ncbi:MAG: AbrB/MazE/SpoVT family DNA-binding domain-containing protein [Kiritimatiellae bacterium]|nr:AbrB/MazE/SpoVT family DNA-binding domain-containing protein [Kiritimatiellia bacterium]